jgi:DNA-binding IclR family transcriptional regulator
MERDARPSPYTIDSVENALRILLALRERTSMRVTDVSEELGVARSTAHRLLSTMAAHGFVVQNPATREYHSGRVLVEIGLAAVGNIDVRRVAHPHIRALSAELHETVNLLVLQGDRTRFIDGVEGDQAIRIGTRTGLVLPANSTSAGKVLLAELPFEEVRALFAPGLPTVTNRTVVELDQLEEELATVRELGYATNFGESEPGLNAVAVPIRAGLGWAVAAIAVSTPAVRMTPADVPRFASSLEATAAAIAEGLV